ncbi:MAG TPA: RnfABCDGE type electron transport complex subunit D [Devosiaceae bacterium]|nr:RnfABCDGE type electron transport complex subunit D [Devosiaceae bacterium]
MLTFVDRVTDRITMYRLVLYYLATLLGGAFLLGIFRVIQVDPTALAFSVVLITVSCWITNMVFTKVFRAVPNLESLFITALILALILDPTTATDLSGVGLLIFASVWAMAAKFVFSIRRRHAFNPAALGVALPGLLLNEPASWWISGIIWLSPVVLVGGVLLVRKLRRFDLVLSFAAVNLIATLITSSPDEYLSQAQLTVLHTPFFFFAFVMLTEPLTAPQQKIWRIVYGALVGVLASPNIHVADFYFTPELALLAGNLLTLVVSPAGRVVLTLQRIEKAANGAFDFIFSSDRQLAFAAGQYLEWTLPLRRPDDRGNRRYFTIASAPSEEEIRLGVRLSPKGSAFKRELAELRPGDSIVASQLAGSFVLPRDPRQKLVFIAGGIGITPFRSMLGELLERDEARPITVLYGNGSIGEIAYGDILEAAARRLGINTHYAVLNRDGATPDMTIGFIDEETIRSCVPDFRDRVFYISGPQPMVAAQRRHLRNMGVPPWRIKTDFFPGLA